MPIVAILAVRRWRVLVGFAPVALLLGGVSVAIMGWRGPLDYVRFVINLEATSARGFDRRLVPNLRGLVTNLPRLVLLDPSIIALIILTLSLAAFLIALHRARSGPDSIIFLSSLAVVTSILISFHALVYDLTPAVSDVTFPAFAGRSIRREDNRRLDDDSARPSYLFLSPIYMFLLLVTERFFWYSLILLWLYLSLAGPGFTANEGKGI